MTHGDGDAAIALPADAAARLSGLLRFALDRGAGRLRIEEDGEAGILSIADADGRERELRADAPPDAARLVAEGLACAAMDRGDHYRDDARVVRLSELLGPGAGGHVAVELRGAGGPRSGGPLLEIRFGAAPDGTSEAGYGDDPALHLEIGPPGDPAARDFVVGDVHGHFRTLERLLDQVGFVPGRDRLFSVGDLVDRGRHSGEALDWIEAGRFAGVVRGNHEQMALEALTGEGLQGESAYELRSRWAWSGNAWWREGGEADRRERWLATLSGLPWTARIRTGTGGAVGLVHASPLAPRLSAHRRMIALGDRRAMMRTIWSRLRYFPQLDIGETGEEWRGDVEDVDLLVCGHTPQGEPDLRGNVLNIDTGVHRGYEGRLTLAEIGADPVAFHHCARDPEDEYRARRV